MSLPVSYTHLDVYKRQYVDCPFCGDRRGKMNVNFQKNVWRCNYCGKYGGMLALYAEFNHTTTSDAYWEIAEALCDNIQEEHARSGNGAHQQPASTGSPPLGTRTAAAAHSFSEREMVPQSDKASPAEIHQTLSLLLSLIHIYRCFFCCLYGNNEDETIIREIRRDAADVYKRQLLQIDPAERPAAVQLFGSEPDIMAEIAARLEEGPYEMCIRDRR